MGQGSKKNGNRNFSIIGFPFTAYTMPPFSFYLIKVLVGRIKPLYLNCFWIIDFFLFTKPFRPLLYGSLHVNVATVYYKIATLNINLYVST